MWDGFAGKLHNSLQYAYIRTRSLKTLLIYLQITNITWSTLPAQYAQLFLVLKTPIMSMMATSIAIYTTRRGLPQSVQVATVPS
jgi:hypothetical protein